MLKEKHNWQEMVAMEYNLVTHFSQETSLFCFVLFCLLFVEICAVYCISKKLST
jgi:hypothetical protein